MTVFLAQHILLLSTLTLYYQTILCKGHSNMPGPTCWTTTPSSRLQHGDPLSSMSWSTSSSVYPVFYSSSYLSCRGLKSSRYMMCIVDVARLIAAFYSGTGCTEKFLPPWSLLKGVFPLRTFMAYPQYMLIMSDGCRFTRGLWDDCSPWGETTSFRHLCQILWVCPKCPCCEYLFNQTYLQKHLHPHLPIILPTFYSVFLLWRQRL